MSIAVTLDLREFESVQAAPLTSTVQHERTRRRQQRVRRIADDVRARVYPVDADRVAASILRHLVV